jgi:hypothetical protein
MDQLGTVTPSKQCAHPGCEKFVQLVTEDYCKACPLRTAPDIQDIMPVPKPEEIPRATLRDFEQPVVLDNGNIVYPKTGWEPPVTPAGYTRSPDDDWVFIPTWPPCVDRRTMNSVRPCGCINIQAVCLSKVAPTLGQTVTAEICQKCPHRRTTENTS